MQPTEQTSTSRKYSKFTLGWHISNARRRAMGPASFSLRPLSAEAGRSLLRTVMNHKGLGSQVPQPPFLQIPAVFQHLPQHLQGQAAVPGLPQGQGHILDKMFEEKPRGMVSGENFSPQSVHLLAPRRPRGQRPQEFSAVQPLGLGIAQSLAETGQGPGNHDLVGQFGMLSAACGAWWLRLVPMAASRGRQAW